MENALKMSQGYETIPAERTTTVDMFINEGCNHVNDEGKSYLYPIGHKIVQCAKCKLINNGKVPNERYHILKCGSVIL